MNETSEILKKVRRIEIKSRGLTNQIFSGQYHSAFKGRGMAFSEVREYIYGDDIRSIDWNVTARFNHPYIKIFEEERELTVMLLVDVSASNGFGTNVQFKSEIITEIAAVIAFSAIKNNDKVGVIFFSDKIEKFIPPKKGTSHILRIIRELIDFKADKKGTNISKAMEYLSNVIKKRCTAFVLSDFMDKDFQKAFMIAGKKHDVIALNVFDQKETFLPNVGLLKIKDNETDTSSWVDTSSASVRNYYNEQWRKHNESIHQVFNRCGVDVADIETGSDFVKPLTKLFKMRQARF